MLQRVCSDLLVSNVQAAACGALAIHHLAAVGGLHASAEANASLALDAAGAVRIVHIEILRKTLTLAQAGQVGPRY
jgi:hypothetical protein